MVPVATPDPRNGRLQRLLLGLAFAIGIHALVVTLYLVANPATQPGLERIAILLGGDLAGGGYIQFLTLAGFLWGLLEVRHFRGGVRFEARYFQTDLLPRDPHTILDADGVNRIRMQVERYLHDKAPQYPGARFLLFQLIRKAAVKFRANHSAEAAFQIVESQSRIDRDRSESAQSGIRYLIWALPSIGFVGTVLGISRALAIADSGDLERITRTLGLAFDTTLVALVLSLILVYLFHDLQEQTDVLHQDVEAWVIEHLINRMDVE
jgi:biopolymer transport protein ExbB/TolQ